MGTKNKIVQCPNCGGCKILYTDGDLNKPRLCDWCEGSGKIQITMVQKEWDVNWVYEK